MAGRLHDYRRRRDFERTPEPRGAPPAAAGAARFVVHRHEARRLHYDLRLEADGVLVSWAVPRGFSHDPAQKRLAVRTEDHPLEYAAFEGVIPAGEYGAGTMTVWDEGGYELVAGTMGQGLEAGEVKVHLRGRKLRGEWHLVRTRGERESWLLFKSRDRYAGPDRSTVLGTGLRGARRGGGSPRLRLMSAGAESAPFDDPDWVFEMEFEGRRTLARVEGGAVHLRGLRRVPGELAEGLVAVRAERALIDGVLVALDEHDRPDAAALEGALAGDGTAVFLYAFDLPCWEDLDLRPLPLLERKVALRNLLPGHHRLLYVDHVAGRGHELAATVAAAGLPGVVAKRADAAYRAGPSPDWRRIPVEPERGGTVRAVLDRGRGRRGKGRVPRTNPDKAYWPAAGYTKGDLIGWYDRVADVVLPHLRGRWVHVHRFPDGIDGKDFYQRQWRDHAPPWFPGSAGDEEIRCEDRDTLLYLANLGSIDVHPWLSRRETPEQPDHAVIDLDPKGAPFADVVRIARLCGRLLRGAGLRPYLKTSGKEGLHVFVPVVEGYRYEQTRMFCELVARLVVREVPDRATVERDPGRRGGRVYVDYLQNRRRQTLVAPYAPRPVAGATVSTPLEWDELEEGITPGDFTMGTVGRRIEERGDLFRGVLTDRQDLLPAIAALHSQLPDPS